MLSHRAGMCTKHSCTVCNQHVNAARRAWCCAKHVRVERTGLMLADMLTESYCISNNIGYDID